LIADPMLLDPDAIAPEELPPEPDVPEPMDEDEAKEAAKHILKDAREYVESEVHPALERAWHYYHGGVNASPMWPVTDSLTGEVAIDPDTGEEIYEGSAVVVTICWDTVNAILPEMYRVFTASQEVVDFIPHGGEDVEHATQATAYTHLQWRRNAGEDILNGAMLDYLVKFVAFRVTWQDETAYESGEFSGLDETAVMALSNDDGIVGLDAVPSVQIIRSTQMDPATGAMMPVEVPITTYAGRYTRAKPAGRLAIETIPQEELIVDGESATLESARCIGQWGRRLAADVIATGIDAATVLEYAGEDDQTNRGDEVARARTGDEQHVNSNNATDDPALQFVTYIEAIIRLDADRDGIAERYRVVALGNEAEVVTMELADDVHFVIDSPYERPHRIIGDGVVEKTMDLQDMATSLYRAVINNLNRSISPREVVTGDDAEALQALESVFRGPIPAQTGTTIGWHAVPFVGQQAFPIMEYIEGRAASRTGVSMAGQGLDPDVLKGQTVDAAKAIVSAPQSRVEYLIRRFAIGVMRRVFRAILKLSAAHQNQPEMVRLQGRWEPVDPRAWNTDMDCEPNVGLGTGTRQEKIAALSMVAMAQKELILAGSPLVTQIEYRRTLAEIANLAGLKNDDAYFKDLTPEELAQAEQQQQQQAMQAAQMDAQMAAQAKAAEEQAKAQAAAQKAQADLAADLQKMQAEWQIEQQRMRIQHELRMEAIDREVQRELALMRAGHMAGNADLRQTTFKR
jgi:hypothetical protein